MRCTRSVIVPALAAGLVVASVPLTAGSASSASPAASSAAIAAPGWAVAASSTGVVAESPAPSLSDVNDARDRLEAESAAIGKTKAAVERAEAKMPAAQRDVAKADEAVSTAQAAVEAAKRDVQIAQERVAEQKKQVAEAQVIIDELEIEVSKLARRSYIQGGEYQTLEMIMGASDPSDFANQAVAVKRMSRSNAMTYERLVAAKQVLTDKLAELKVLEEATVARQQEALARASEARKALAVAASAKAAVEALIGERQAALDKAAAQLRDIRRTYNQVLDQYQTAQERKAGGSTVVAGVRYPPSRSGKAVVNWAMQYIGRGSSYDHLCLAFVDDAYGATGGWMPRAIDQWYRAKKAGYGHPGDRTPPVGAQVFWLSSNPARHVAIYAGGGMVITTGGDGDRVAILSMRTMDAWGPYIGWAPGYYG